MLVDTEPLELVEDALLWLWWWAWCMDRIDDTEDDVDLRPRRPVEDRRMVPRGVKGDGERDCRLRVICPVEGCARRAWLKYETAPWPPGPALVDGVVEASGGVKPPLPA